jgi:8-oxo-dGTP pyrophosphatase MutT (NUDIX family)
VSFIVVSGDWVLAEKRKLSKKVMPGAITLPGGHFEPGEYAEAAFARELYEELDISATEWMYVCTALHESVELRRVRYFAVQQWRGVIHNQEADALLWLPLEDPSQLVLDIDRAAVAEYLRVAALQKSQLSAPPSL